MNVPVEVVVEAALALPHSPPLLRALLLAGSTSIRSGIHQQEGSQER